MNKKLSLAVDFDGVIHKYSKGWQGGDIYDPPMDGALESLKKLHSDFNIIIFTTRLSPAFNDTEKQKAAMNEWFTKYGFIKGEHFDEMTGSKPRAHIYLDDRGMKFVNWADSVQGILDYQVSKRK